MILQQIINYNLNEKQIRDHEPSSKEYDGL